MIEIIESLRSDWMLGKKDTRTALSEAYIAGGGEENPWRPLSEIPEESGLEVEVVCRTGKPGFERTARDFYTLPLPSYIFNESSYWKVFWCFARKPPY